MKLTRFASFVLLPLLLRVGHAQTLTTKNSPWVIGWIAKYQIPGNQSRAYFSAIDKLGNSFLVTLDNPLNAAETIHIYKVSPYGDLIKSTTVSGLYYLAPSGFAVDGLEDVFLTFDQEDQFFSSNSEVVDGWDSNGNVIFSKTVAGGITGLGLATDSSNNVYEADTEYIAGSPAFRYTKYSRSGLQSFSVTHGNVPLHINFDSIGRCSAVGYGTHTNQQVAVVFNNLTGHVDFSKTLINTSTDTYSLGGGSFDAAGNFYLNTTTATSAGATSTCECFNKSFAKAWLVNGIPGYTPFGAAADPVHAFVWGYPDQSESTYFVASVGGGVLRGNTPVKGLFRGGFVDPVAASENFNGFLYYLNGIAGFSVGTTPGENDNYAFSVGGYSFDTTSWETINTLTPTNYPLSACYNLNFQANGSATAQGWLVVMRRGILLNSMQTPATCPSRGTFPITPTLNSAAPAAGVKIDLSVTGATFTGGVTSKSVTIPSGQSSIAVVVDAPPTNVNKVMRVRSQGQGVTRMAYVTELGPVVKTVQVNNVVTAPSDTTDAYIVTVDLAAAPGGLPVTITSSDTSVIPNTSGTIAAGYATLKGSLTIHKVSAQKVVKVTFKTANNKGVQEAVTVKP